MTEPARPPPKEWLPDAPKQEQTKVQEGGGAEAELGRGQVHEEGKEQRTEVELAAQVELKSARVEQAELKITRVELKTTMVEQVELNTTRIELRSTRMEQTEQKTTMAEQTDQKTRAETETL